MGLPGHRRTSSDKRKRAAHFGLKKMQLSVCQKCKKPAMSHRACAFCGFYAGREVSAKSIVTTKLAGAGKKTAKVAKKTSKSAKKEVAHDHPEVKE